MKSRNPRISPVSIKKLPQARITEFLQLLLHRVFAEGCRLETAHSEALRTIEKPDRAAYQALFHDARSLLTHWRLLCFLADLDLQLDATRVSTVWPILMELKGEKSEMCLGASGESSWPARWVSTLTKAKALPEVFYSYPDDFFQQLTSGLPGAAHPSILSRLNQPTPPDLRVNSLKTKTETVTEVLKKQGFRVTRFSPDGLQVSGDSNLYLTASYRNGEFEIQDRHSQQVAPFAGVKPGDRILDACAGAGGKTLHLAVLMQNRGRLIAMDIFPQKLELLSQRARRAGAHCIETRLKTSTKVVKRLKASMDVVLLDVPCSGSGTIRQHPEIKWQSTAESRQTILDTQVELLRQHAPVVKPGGVLVYSTCSLFENENGSQIQAFLKNHPEYAEEDRVTAYPQDEGGHGFFMCRLRRQS